MANPTILSTKMLLPSLKRSVEAHKIELIEKEFISVHPILTKEKYNEIYNYIMKDNVYAVFTSANAIDPFKKYLHQNNVHYMVNWKIFCLSNQTRKALYPYFLEENILETANNATELANKILACGIKEVVFFCGNKRREDLPEILISNGIRLHEVVVYETIKTPSLIKETLDGILFFSPSGADSYFSMNHPGENITCFAIGETTAKAIAAYGNYKIVTSRSPGQEELIEELIQYYSNQ